jgi:hypothetical protein
MEAMLSSEYRSQVKNAKHLKSNVSYTSFDFHAMVKGKSYERVSILVDSLAYELDDRGFSLMDKTGQCIMGQGGVVRVNCLDCLDRTNVVQW